MQNSAIGDFVTRFNDVILNPIIGLLFALALVLFLWGIVEFFWQADSDLARQKGKSHMLWGLIGLFIMFAVFAIMKIIVNTIGAPTPPGLP